jgi:hypothetical protein
LGTFQKLFYEGGGFGLIFFGGEVVERKKMLFQIFFEVLMVG